MEVCPSCFSDFTLRDLIVNRSKRIGVCPECKHNGPLVDVRVLFDEFFGLSKFYTTSIQSDYVLFSQIIQKDWHVFKNDNTEFHQRVICEVFKGSTDEFIKPQMWSLIQHPEVNDEWNRFSKDIQHTSRFFFSPPFKSVQLDQLYSRLEETIKEGMVLYRARLNIHNSRFNKRSMGAPSSTQANGGRANPKGIPYLYLASDENTAISEIRPAKGQTVTVGCFKTCKELKLVKFQDLSPFKLIFNTEEGLEYSKVNRVLELIMKKLSEPIDPMIADLEYLTTQYICEEIKNMGYDGVSFDSAMGSGMNFALFYPLGCCICSTTKQRTVKDISYDIQKR